MGDTLSQATLPSSDITTTPSKHDGKKKRKRDECESSEDGSDREESVTRAVKVRRTDEQRAGAEQDADVAPQTILDTEIPSTPLPSIDSVELPQMAATRSLSGTGRKSIESRHSVGEEVDAVRASRSRKSVKTPRGNLEERGSSDVLGQVARSHHFGPEEVDAVRTSRSRKSVKTPKRNMEKLDLSGPDDITRSSRVRSSAKTFTKNGEVQDRKRKRAFTAQTPSTPKSIQVGKTEVEKRSSRRTNPIAQSIPSQDQTGTSGNSDDEDDLFIEKTPAEMELAQLKPLTEPDMRSDGPWTEDEQNALRVILSAFQEENNITTAHLVDVIQWTAPHKSPQDLSPEDQLRLHDSNMLWSYVMESIRALGGHRPSKRIKEYTRRRYTSHRRTDKWTILDDTRLIDLVDAHGEHWTTVAARMGTRSAQACHNRWRDHLKQNNNRKSYAWSEDEVRLLRGAVAQQENAAPSEINWAAVSRAMGESRNNRQCRKKWLKLVEIESMER